MLGKDCTSSLQRDIPATKMPIYVGYISLQQGVGAYKRYQFNLDKLGTKMAATFTSVAPWKQLLLNAMEFNAHLKHSTYLQLATIGSNGRPANRTVVFRGFQDDSNNIQINTDYRSCKVEDLKHCPFAEICWYFTDSWEQFRISGTVDVIDGSNPDPVKLLQREKAWFASSPRSRLQYLGPSPGLPCINEEPGQETSLDPSTGPVHAFCLLVLDPEQVDYLNLKSNHRLSFTSKQTDEGKCWITEKVNP